MAIPTSFRELQEEIFPRWCRKSKMAAFLAAFSIKKDEVVDRLAGSILARSASNAPDDALEAIGGNFYLERSLVDTVATFRAYLKLPFSRWRRGGTPAGLLTELAHLGYRNCQIVTYRDLVDGGEPSTVFGGMSSFWFLRILPPHPWGQPGRWDVPPGEWDNAPYTWDSSATAAEIDELRRVIAKWKPAATSCRYIEVMAPTLPPTVLVRWPVWEQWEVLPDASRVDYYNSGY